MMCRHLFLLCGSLVLFLSACSPLQWEPSIRGSAEISWPPPPQEAKARYIGSIDGFKQNGFSLGSLLLGKGVSGQILKPVAVAVEKDGRMAIADLERQGIHYYHPGEKKYRFLYKAAGGEELRSPVGVAFDGILNLYVADSLLRKIFIYDRNGKPVGQIDRAGQTPFGRPTGLSFQKRGGLLHVADTALHQIHVFSVEGGYLHSIGSRGSEPGSFNFPSHITADYQGKIYVNDTLNFRVQLFDQQEFIGQFGQHGNGSGDFAMPKGIAVDRWQTIYVADSLFDCVQLFDPQGRFLLTLGSRGTGPGEFWLPSGLFIDETDRLYVCDTYNQRIQIFQLAAHQAEERP